MIEAEAQLRAGNAAGVAGHAERARARRSPASRRSPMPARDAARVDQLFRERAFWLFGRGHRAGRPAPAHPAVQPRREHGLPDGRVAQGRQLRHRRHHPGAAGGAEQSECIRAAVPRPDGLIKR